MNRRRWAIIGVILLILVVAAGFVLTRRSDKRETATAHLGSIDVTIQTVGTIQADGPAVVRSDVNGVVAHLGASAGDVVEAGDIIALLDRAPFEQAVRDAEDQLTQSEYAQQAAEQRSNDNPDDTGLKLDALAAANNAGKARAALEEAKDRLRDTVIVASGSGTVIELPVTEGDPVTAKQVIARIVSPDQLRLVADVDELDLPNVHPGAVVTFRLDAYPATEITGSVVSTAPSAKQQGGATIFATTISYTPPEGIDVRPGMNADVTIVTEQRTGVLLIPERALRTVGERSYVDVRIDGRTEEREVTLGYRAQGQVEVVDGLQEGDVVVLQ